jgi:hypothetical protein
MTLFNQPGREWEAVNVKRPTNSYVEKKDKVDLARKTLGLVQLVLSAVVLFKKFRSKK